MRQCFNVMYKPEQGHYKPPFIKSSARYAKKQKKPGFPGLKNW